MLVWDGWGPASFWWVSHSNRPDSWGYSRSWHSRRCHQRTSMVLCRVMGGSELDRNSLSPSERQSARGSEWVSFTFPHLYYLPRKQAMPMVLIEHALIRLINFMLSSVRVFRHPCACLGVCLCNTARLQTRKKGWTYHWTGVYWTMLNMD